MLAAILCSIASFVALTWVVPVSNQAFRVAALSDSFIPKGLAELTLGELRSRIEVNRRLGRDVSPTAMTYHSRWALAAAPIVLTAWAFLLIGRLPHARPLAARHRGCRVVRRLLVVGERRSGRGVPRNVTADGRRVAAECGLRRGDRLVPLGPTNPNDERRTASVLDSNAFRPTETRADELRVGPAPAAAK